ncbi:MarR family winged helix-turn-helix transcriptional regulator [Domibacillus enclensis]|uniref:DNA-binding transcriptional regulator, MarR family n=1 Tax=Domibacillus enclensis TaxID=1017273 RepID=A0A1N6SVD5_9BACI|nr:MarR family transcriptional regulator [Domibacillus enclensis]OXS79428.1 MarR family transcriptional regulator [Domibacillus enclensis]SIQ45049.1 DNA-binding transcriptional regulator, MarR family [Domibacillus enclensis]
MYKLDESLGYKLFQGSRLMTNRLNQYFRLKGYPITHEQWQVLSRLFDRDGQTQQSLASLNERDEPSVSRLVANMERSGLIERRPHPTDKRINLVFLSEQSKRLQDEYTAIAEQTIQDASSGIDPDVFAECLRTLDQIRRNLS